MQQKWQQLAPEQQQNFKIGAIVLTLVIAYFIFYLPLQHSIQRLQQNVQQQQSLLTWMEAANKKITALQHNQGAKITVEISQPLLPIIEQSLKSSNLNKQLSELTQTETNKVRLKFKQVAFDSLITWLTTLWQKQGIETIELNVIPQKKPGIVEASVLLASYKANEAQTKSE